MLAHWPWDLTKNADLAGLLELEEMLSQLMVSALKLPPGAESQDSVILIGCFRERIAAMKRSEVDRANPLQKRA